MIEEVLESWRTEEDFGVCALFSFSLIWEGCCGGERRIWRGWEMRGIGVHNMKFPKTQ